MRAACRNGAARRLMILSTAGRGDDQLPSIRRPVRKLRTMERGCGSATGNSEPQDTPRVALRQLPCA